MRFTLFLREDCAGGVKTFLFLGRLFGMLLKLLTWIMGFIGGFFPIISGVEDSESLEGLLTVVTLFLSMRID